MSLQIAALLPQTFRMEAIWKRQSFLTIQKFFHGGATAVTSYLPSKMSGAINAHFF
jgi:hypothetical protein